jgi:hypothetical protein
MGSAVAKPSSVAEAMADKTAREDSWDLWGTANRERQTVNREPLVVAGVVPNG